MTVIPKCWGAWYAHGVDYHVPCWPVGSNTVIFPGIGLNGFRDARVVQGDQSIPLDVRFLDDKGLLAAGTWKDAIVEGSEIQLMSQGEAALFLCAFDIHATPLEALPPIREGAQFWSVTQEGALLDYWTVLNKNWCSIRIFSLLKEIVQESYPQDIHPSLRACTLVSYQPEGVLRTIEEVIAEMGFEVIQVRRGRRSWRIKQGSALLLLDYSEENATLSAEVQLVKIGPSTQRKALLTYLLKENAQLQKHGFSLHEDKVVITEAISARYLSLQRTSDHLKRLLEISDHYDHLLVTKFGAAWIPSSRAADSR